MEYNANPSTNHTTSVTAESTGITGRFRAPVTRMRVSAQATVMPNCASPSRPMPMTLPASSCHGSTVASSTSTTRLDFSSVPQIINKAPQIRMAMYSIIIPA